MRVAFQGEHGAYSELAIFNHFSKDTQTVPCKSFQDVFKAIIEGKADAGMLPVRNSTAGAVTQAYEQFLEHNIQIVDEHFQPIEHCLLGTSHLNEIKEVFSHPQALAQCQDFIKGHNLLPIAVYDTAGAAKTLAENPNPRHAVIASEAAAKRYHLSTLKKGIQTVNNNTTHFFILAKEPKTKEDTQYKTSLVFEARNIPAALYKCLGGFATNDVNLTMLTSAPSKDKQWDYLFYVDLEGHQEDQNVKQALEELKFFTHYLKILGSYPKRS